MKRPGPESDPSPPHESKKICSDEDTIASLLAKIETEFQYREKIKEEALTKWEQEGTSPLCNLYNRHRRISLISLIVKATA
jgi:hypothetical protein